MKAVKYQLNERKDKGIETSTNIVFSFAIAASRKYKLLHFFEMQWQTHVG